MLARSNINIGTSSGGIFIFNAWLALCVLGLVMVASVSVDFSRVSQQSIWYFSIRHGVDLIISFAVLVGAWLTPLASWQRYHKVLFVVAIALLAAPLIPDISFADAEQRRWIGNGSMAWQPIEAFKFLFVIYAAALLERKGDALKQSNHHLVHICLIALVPMLLLFMQFDYGTALIISVIFALMLYVVGLPLFKCGVLIAVWALLGAALMYASTIEDVVGEQVAPLTNILVDAPPLIPEQPAQAAPEDEFHFGEGNLFGVGLGRSTTKMAYLSEAHTNQIFTVLSEELGFISASLVIMLFTLLMLRGSFLGWYYMREQDVFRGLLMVGASLLLVLPALVNIAINLGVLPKLNASLPFISYGANQLIFSSALIGVLLSGESEYHNRTTDRSATHVG